jgi:hypothetical protein
VPSLESLVETLIRGKVEFVLVGGFAAVAHGASLVTRDVDVCCRFSPDNLLRLQDCLRDLHPRHRMSPAHPPLELTRENVSTFENLYLETDLGPLDCLSSVIGVGSFEEALKQSEDLNLPSGICRLLRIDALIRSKEAMSRPRDREAILQLKAILERT